MFENKFSLFVGPTGLGKTEILMGIIEKSILLMPEVKILFVVNKLNLLFQTKTRIERTLGMFVDVCSGKHLPSERLKITLTTVQSYPKIKNKNFNLIIMDEAHNIDQDKGRYCDLVETSVSANERVRFVACTATPFRAKGGSIHGKDCWFKDICFKKDLLWAVENNFLVKATMKKVEEEFETKHLKISMGDYNKIDLEELVSDDEKIRRQINDAMPRLKSREHIIWACVGINHAEAVYKQLKDMGELCSIIHSKQNTEAKQNNILDFESFKSRHLVFVTIVSEGYDFPPIDAIVLMRPTRSPVLYVQTVGRGLRPSENKKDCLVLDYGRVVRSLGPLHDPVLDNKKKKEINMKVCPGCGSYVEKSSKACPDCGYEFKSKKKTISQLKNLTQSHVDGFIMSNGEFIDFVFESTGLLVSLHTSLAGNRCVKFQFTPLNLMDESVCEYCSIEKSDYWLLQTIDKVNNCFGLMLKSNLDCEEILEEIDNGPLAYGFKEVVEIPVRRQGRYWNISWSKFS